MMPGFWEEAFCANQMMWGLEPTASARFCLQQRYFVASSAASADPPDILIPGIGYGRNARPFLDAGMAVTGIEISETAIEMARTKLNLQIPIHHGSVEDMPFDGDDKQYDGVFCFGLLYLLDAEGRNKMLRDCYHQLKPGGYMIFTVISKKAPMFDQGPCLGEDSYERVPGLAMFFYDDQSIDREFKPYGLVEASEIMEHGPHGQPIPFINVVCQKEKSTSSDGGHR